MTQIMKYERKQIFNVNKQWTQIIRVNDTNYKSKQIFKVR